MSWIKTKDNLPGDDQWCWVFANDKWIERGCYDAGNKRWLINEGDIILDVAHVSHWQPYFTPAPPDAYDTTKLKGIHDV